MSRKKSLLDVLSAQYPDVSRDELYRYIMCGEVHRETERMRDPREPVDPRQRFTITRARFVSRGGAKLAAALFAWGISPAGRCWVDAGSSAGGFSDCLLQHGADCIHAIDVGYNQLDYRLRRDSRVRVRERTNILHVTALDPIPDAAVCDLSFRSLRGVLPHVLNLTSLGWGIALLKPQFEMAAELRWGKRGQDDSREGVVPDDLRQQVIDGAILDLEAEGVRILRRVVSPIPGRRGNREELLLAGLAGSRFSREFTRENRWP